MTTSRRTFLRNSSLTVAGASLTGLSLTQAAHGNPTSDKKIKVGLIGAGNRGRGAVFDCIKNNANAELVTMCDAFEEKAQSTAKLFQKKLGERGTVAPDQIFSGFEGAQKVIDSDIDLVLIATPPGFRPMHYQAAIEAGKHVFMEKPCCV
ncbi:MAG: Gfo/Idh/MocA family oxidoreductase, partial [Planctomycetia bacterium]